MAQNTMAYTMPREAVINIHAEWSSSVTVAKGSWYPIGIGAFVMVYCCRVVATQVIDGKEMYRKQSHKNGLAKTEEKSQRKIRKKRCEHTLEERAKQIPMISHAASGTTPTTICLA